MTAPTITGLPLFPPLGDPDYATEAQASASAMTPMVTEINAFGTYLNSNVLVAYAWGDGTVSAPSIHPASDADSGIYFPAANEVAVAVGGVQKLLLNSTGLVVVDGVYLGGTGAANLLDDYEEGTWTPGLSDGTNNRCVCCYIH